VRFSIIGRLHLDLAIVRPCIFVALASCSQRTGQSTSAEQTTSVPAAEVADSPGWRGGKCPSTALTRRCFLVPFLIRRPGNDRILLIDPPERAHSVGGFPGPVICSPARPSRSPRCVLHGRRQGGESLRRKTILS